jgi:citrate lyase beta subunit
MPDGAPGAPPPGLNSGLTTARSLLFAPGDDEHKLRNALGSGADGLIADLEDGVAPGRKETARAVARRVLAEASGSPCLRMVRINGLQGGALREDLAALEGITLDAVVLPKAAPAALAALGADGPPVLAIVETSVGLRSAHELAAAPRVAALALGALDLGLELGLERRDDGQEILLARSQLVLDSAAAGVRPPFDTVFEALGDPLGLERECDLARSLGMRGKLCVHPGQVEVVNRVFSPREADLARARCVVDAYDRAEAQGRGAVAVDGMLVDRPVVERARRLLTEAGRSPSAG